MFPCGVLSFSGVFLASRAAASRLLGFFEESVMETNINLNEIVPSRIGRVVAVEVNRDGTASFFVRHRDDRVERVNQPFEPFLLVHGESLARSLPGSSRVVRLTGTGIHDHRVHFPDLPTLEKGEKFLKVETGMNATSPTAPFRFFSDREQQALALLPVRLFRGMDFAELRRLQIDIETLTTPGYDFPNAERPGDEIVMVALSDSTGWKICLSGPELSEKAILEQTLQLIRDRDPDVIEGHNLFNFDLPYLEMRARRQGLELALGRDGSPATSRSSRVTFGDTASTYFRYEAFGRHIIDTMHLVQLYDVSARDLESYGLKSAARHFGVAAPDRTYVDGKDISRLYREDPARLRDYNLDDVAETEAISRLLSPSHFYQTQLIPVTYQNCIVRGNATRIDALMTSAYLLADKALPSPQAPRQYQGGLTESFKTGIFHNVWHMDVQSLYPSIMVADALNPASDTQGIFIHLLAELRQFRLAAKAAARAATIARDRDHLAALQKSFKILINSFYGYTGFAQATFNDFTLAERVTCTGRRILTQMKEALAARGAELIEMDTDGLYFVPPAGVEAAMLEAEIQRILPPGIEVELDQTYKAMFGYKSKNYALLGHDDRVSITGAALKSRGLERFQRQYMRDVITLLLLDRRSEIVTLGQRLEDAIRSHTLPLTELAKRETLSASPETYQRDLTAGKARRSAAFELALKSPRDYRQGDQIAYYVTGTRRTASVAENAKLLADNRGERDENVAFYLDKLAELRKKFTAFTGDSDQPLLF
jgi:DNA polymerase elongation subunit (family B)